MTTRRELLIALGAGVVAGPLVAIAEQQSPADLFRADRVIE